MSFQSPVGIGLKVSSKINLTNLCIVDLSIVCILFLAYFCQSDIQCNNKGTCQNGTCECQPGWEKKLDCTGIKLEIFYDLVHEMGFTARSATAPILGQKNHRVVQNRAI